ncbi:MAG: S26 family signal peptidase [Thermoplasmata archaeon]|nr:S26 family signal peptidase [Thermoplasmata archaeon]
MPSRRPPADDEGADDEESPRAPSTSHHGRTRGAKRDPVRRWSDEQEAPEEEPEPRRGRRARDSAVGAPPEKERVYFRARDSAYFEPLVALAVVLVLLVGLFAYTQNWPPMYVVESDSMQHGYSDQVGLINTGDLVLAQKVTQDQLTPYVVAAQSGYTTYGEYGDVILYHPNGDTSGAPIIHRALVFVSVVGGLYNLPELQGQPCGAASNAVYSVSLTLNSCGTSNIPGSSTLTLFHVGWRSVNVVVPLSALGGSSGFLTMGDNNFNPGDTSQGDPDQPFLSSLVEPAWIVGAARGMLPWFGSVKLLLDGNSAEVPSQSWSYMGLSLVAIIGGAILLHLFLRAEGIQDERRKARDAERRAANPDAEEDDEPPTPHRWRSALRHWRHPDEDRDTGSGGTPPTSPTGGEHRTTFGGRPRPEVGRAERRTKHKPPTDDDL